MCCLFYHICTNKRYYGNMPVIYANKKQMNVYVAEQTYNHIKILANDSQMKLNDFINSAIKKTLENFNIQTIILNWKAWT